MSALTGVLLSGRVVPNARGAPPRPPIASIEDAFARIDGATLLSPPLGHRRGEVYVGELLCGGEAAYRLENRDLSGARNDSLRVGSNGIVHVLRAVGEGGAPRSLCVKTFADAATGAAERRAVEAIATVPPGANIHRVRAAWRDLSVAQGEGGGPATVGVVLMEAAENAIHVAAANGGLGPADAADVVAAIIREVMDIYDHTAHLGRLLMVDVSPGNFVYSFDADDRVLLQAADYGGYLPEHTTTDQCTFISPSIDAIDGGELTVVNLQNFLFACGATFLSLYEGASRSFKDTRFTLEGAYNSDADAERDADVAAWARSDPAVAPAVAYLLGFNLATGAFEATQGPGARAASVVTALRLLDALALGEPAAGDGKGSGGDGKGA